MRPAPSAQAVADSVVAVVGLAFDTDELVAIADRQLRELGARGEQIGQVISVINDIADQIYDGRIVVL